MTKVRQSKHLHVYALLKDAAHENMELLHCSSRDKRNARLEAMLLSALAMEAWLNHIGPRIVMCWGDIERSLSPEQKLLLISEHLAYEPDRGKRPYQTFSDMIKLRNLLAHGRTHRIDILTADEERQPGKFPVEPLLDIEKWFTDSNAKRFVDDMESMIADLWEQVPCKDDLDPPGVFYHHEFISGLE